MLVLSYPVLAEVKAKASVKAYDAYGERGKYLTLIADHYIFIDNDTDKIKNIKICYTICSEFRDCIENNCHIQTIIPHDKFEQSFRNEYKAMYVQSGAYQMIASTKAKDIIIQQDYSKIHIS